jgi:hypothetical protein
MHIGKGKVSALKDKAQADFDEMLIEHYQELREEESRDRDKSNDDDDILGLFRDTGDDLDLRAAKESKAQGEPVEDSFVRPVIRTRGAERREFAPAMPTGEKEADSFQWSRFGVSAAVMAALIALVWVALGLF